MESEPVPQVNFSRNKELKYLREYLAPIKDPSIKGAIYLTYLANCDFNTDMEPNSIIEFVDDDMEKLLSIEDNPDRAMQVRNFSQSQCVKITFVLSC